MNRRHPLHLCTVLSCLVAFGAACATVDTADPIAQDWPDQNLSPWQNLETPMNPSPQGWDEEEVAEQVPTARGGIFEVGFQVYRHSITQIDGPRCEHRPTCSVYSYRAVQKHGVIVGMWLGVDRLMRGNQSSIHRRLPTHSVRDGVMYYHDPVENNDFFL